MILQLRGSITESDTEATEVEGKREMKNSSSRHRKIVVQITGCKIRYLQYRATLYHLLSGSKPAKNAEGSRIAFRKEYRPQVVEIIKKAMNPNRICDIRRHRTCVQIFTSERPVSQVRRLKAVKRLDIGAVLLILAAGASMTFVGLKRMQTTENWLKLAEYSKSALESGDVDGRSGTLSQVFPEEKGILTPEWLPESKRALANALGCMISPTSFGRAGLKLRRLLIR